MRRCTTSRFEKYLNIRALLVYNRNNLKSNYSVRHSAREKRKPDESATKNDLPPEILLSMRRKNRTNELVDLFEFPILRALQNRFRRAGLGAARDRWFRLDFQHRRRLRLFSCAGQAFARGFDSFARNGDGNQKNRAESIVRRKNSGEHSR